MRYYSDKPEQFDLRDHYWELASRTDRDVAVRVTEPSVLAGEHAGKQIETALVTFRGFCLERAFTLEGDFERSLTCGEAMALFAREPMFVFSYWIDSEGCEICGLGREEPLAVIFAYDAVTVEWDTFAAKPVGELIKR